MIRLKREHMDVMLADCRARAPIEACGIVAGREGASQAVYPAANALNSPVRYRLDPVEQVRLYNELEEKGLDLLAIYHSHPNGPATPSATDTAEAGYPDTVYLIWSRQDGEWTCRGFTIREGRAVETEIEITD